MECKSFEDGPDEISFLSRVDGDGINDDCDEIGIVEGSDEVDDVCDEVNESSLLRIKSNELWYVGAIQAISGSERKPIFQYPIIHKCSKINIYSGQ